MKKRKKEKENKIPAIPETPSLFDAEMCWQCRYIIEPGLGYEMMPEFGGYCICKGWTDSIYGDACELFQRKYGRGQIRDVDPLTKEDWDNINNM